MNASHGTETVHHRICPLCEACCGLEIRMADGKVQSIRGHEADVFSAAWNKPTTWAPFLMMSQFCSATPPVTWKPSFS
jgi:hypothetical protein